ncbi:MAG: hypothetical protein J6P61_00535 [Erysipelotrichaceae bacterium]|nr:hypothetical protein [Erysipelotrichaceae bacterium]
MDLELLLLNLESSGCSIQSAIEIRKLYEAGHLDDALLMIRKHRCSLMDDIHESSRKVDHLDFLIRHMQKEKQTQNI